MSTETLMNLLNQMIDDRCDMFGIRNTITYLKDYGLAQDDIISLGFEEDLVKEVFEEDDE